jgi:hypothetical protein
MWLFDAMAREPKPAPEPGLRIYTRGGLIFIENGPGADCEVRSITLRDRWWLAVLAFARWLERVLP